MLNVDTIFGTIKEKWCREETLRCAALSSLSVPSKRYLQVKETDC